MKMIVGSAMSMRAVVGVGAGDKEGIDSTTGARMRYHAF